MSMYTPRPLCQGEEGQACADDLVISVVTLSCTSTLLERVYGHMWPSMAMC